MAGEVSKDISKRYLLPNDIVKAHEDGLIHFHDMDYYAQHIFNCCLINLEDMLQNGTVISGTKIDTPKSFITACTIATQIIAQVASSQYGGQSVTLAHLAPFVNVSRQKIKANFLEDIEKLGLNISKEKINEIVEERVKNEVRQGIQTLNYQVCTLQTTNGQAPFITFFMYLNEAKNKQEKVDLALIIEEVIKQRTLGLKNEKGVYVAPAFPKLIYVLQEDNIKEGTKYWYLTELAAKCTAKRLVPDYISEKIMKQLKIDKLGIGRCYSVMGCRSALTPFVHEIDIDDENGLWEKLAKTNKIDDSNRIYPTSKIIIKHKSLNSCLMDYEVQYLEKTEEKTIIHLVVPIYSARFNQGVVTINLPDVALTANKDIKKFWRILDSRLELCHKALQCRHNRLEGTTSDISPIHWQFGALARLDKGEKIDKLLHGGYSTLSLGYVGLWETVYSLIEKKLTEPEGEALGLEIMKKLNEYTAKWKAAENIDYSLYGTPEESTTYKFAKCVQKRFGIVPGVTEKNYITNSYHVHVTEPIDAFSKLSLESKFQKLSPGGAISYVEVPNLTNNTSAVLAIMQHIYDNIMYAEINSKSDYCHECNYDGEIQMVKNENGKYIWKCPNCGNENFDKMNICRRVCGYISTNLFNQGRMQEVKERVLHL